MQEIDLAHPDLLVTRELSLLEFNRRVLGQAKDAATPLLERQRLLCISSRNLDEFFELRVAGLKQQIDLGVLGYKTHAWGLQASGGYRRCEPGRRKPRSAQAILLARLAEPRP